MCETLHVCAFISLRCLITAGLWSSLFLSGAPEAGVCASVVRACGSALWVLSTAAAAILSGVPEASVLCPCCFKCCTTTLCPALCQVLMARYYFYPTLPCVVASSTSHVISYHLCVQVLNLMARYRLNRLHWHLVEDQVCCVAFCCRV